MEFEIIYVYILRLDGARYYTGLTKDIARRITEHRTGQSKSTKKYTEIELIYIHAFNNRISARMLEKKIKNRGAYRFMEDRKYKENLPYKNSINNTN